MNKLTINQLKGLEHGLDILKNVSVEERLQAVNQWLEELK
jgi:hypothetical protein